MPVVQPCLTKFGRIQVLANVTLPDDGKNDVPMMADVYLPAHQHHATTGRLLRHHARRSLQSKPLPVVLLLTGFAGPKELFTLASTNLAQAGYVTMVLSQLRNFTGTPAEEDFKQALVRFPCFLWVLGYNLCKHFLAVNASLLSS